MMKKHIVSALACTALFCCTSACVDTPSTTVAVVDVEKVLKESDAAAKGTAHLEQVRKILQNGFDALEVRLKDAPAAERERELKNGALTLNRHLQTEREAVRRTVTAMMLDEVKIWRKDKKNTVVIARQNLLDAGDTDDITAQVIAAMNTKQPAFAPLPKVTVAAPGKAESEKPEPQAELKQSAAQPQTQAPAGKDKNGDKKKKNNK